MTMCIINVKIGELSEYTCQLSRCQPAPVSQQHCTSPLSRYFKQFYLYKDKAWYFVAEVSPNFHQQVSI